MVTIVNIWAVSWDQRYSDEVQMLKLTNVFVTSKHLLPLLVFFFSDSDFLIHEGIREEGEMKLAYGMNPE